MTKPRDPGSPHDALARLFDQAGGVKAAAHFLGKSEFHLRHATDPEDGRDVGWRHVCQLTAAFGATAAAEHLAFAAGGTFVPVEVSESCIMLVTETLARENGEGVAALIAAAIDPHKRKTALQEIDDVIRAAVAARVVLTSRPPEPPVNVTQLRRSA